MSVNQPGLFVKIVEPENVRMLVVPQNKIPSYMWSLTGCFALATFSFLEISYKSIYGYSYLIAPCIHL